MRSSTVNVPAAAGMWINSLPVVITVVPLTVQFFVSADVVASAASVKKSFSPANAITGPVIASVRTSGTEGAAPEMVTSNDAVPIAAVTESMIWKRTVYAPSVVGTHVKSRPACVAICAPVLSSTTHVAG